MNDRLPRRMAGAALAAVSLIVQLPFLRRGLSLYDEGSVLAIADGLRMGEVLYRDRVIPIAPLTYELMAWLLDLFGPHVLVGRVLQAIVFAACVMLTYGILRRFVSLGWAVVGAAAMLALKPLGFPFWTIVNYSQIAYLFSLFAVYATLRFFSGRHRGWLVAAGLGVGLTAVTKQNLGALMALTVGAGLALDAVRRAEPVHSSARWLGALVGGALAPVLIVVIAFAIQGGLGALFERSVLGLLVLAEPYSWPLPGLDLWAERTDELGIYSFAYFPPAVVQLAWLGRLNLYSKPVFLAIECAVKLTYFLPIVAIAAVGWLALGPGTDRERSGSSGLRLIVLFASAYYASMLYRADWEHLMNVYPALLLAAGVLLGRLATAGAAGRAVAVVAYALWFVAGAAVSAAFWTVYQSPVCSARGCLLGAPGEARSAAAVLEHLAARPREEPIAFLRANSLFYFLSGRPVPLRFDLVMPGVVLGAEDDGEIARALLTVERIVLDPTVFPTVPTPLGAYAPETAAVLESRFRVERVLAENAVVLVAAREEGAGSP